MNGWSSPRFGANARGEQIGRPVPPFEYEGDTITVTVSVGVCTLSGETVEVDEFIRRADENLYKAKRNGRNCVVG